MSPMQIELALSVIRLLSTSVQERMREHNELLDLFNQATDEGRDLTEEEVAVFEARARAELKKMGDLNPTI